MYEGALRKNVEAMVLMDLIRSGLHRLHVVTVREKEMLISFRRQNILIERWVQQVYLWTLQNINIELSKEYCIPYYSL